MNKIAGRLYPGIGGGFQITVNGAFDWNTRLRRALPNACFIAFTGTPVFNFQIPTVERFGGLIGSVYTIEPPREFGGRLV